MKKRSWTDEQLISTVLESYSYAEVLRKLNLKPSGGNYSLIKQYISKLNLNISHFTGQAWNLGKNFKPIQPAKSLSEILVENSTWTSTYHLKERLLKEGIKERKCECCCNTEWLGKPIALELHHVNGIKNDLRIENLLILCPNCHAFTDNYRGSKLKVKSAQEETLDVEVG